jgi:hypothetical protein
MGAVYRAVRDDDQYRKEVAIKLVPEQGSGFVEDNLDDAGFSSRCNEL